MLSLREILFVLYIPYKICMLAIQGALWAVGKLGGLAVRGGKALACKVAERRDGDRFLG